MTQQSPPLINPVPQPTRTYLWPVRAISLLLLVQAGGLVAISLHWISQIDWDHELEDVLPSVTAIEAGSFGILCLLLAALALLAGIGFFFLRSSAWLAAMIGQGLLLAGSLTVHFSAQSALRNSFYIYLIMIYAMLMVLYLNTHDVRVTFLVRRSTTPQFDDEFIRSEGLQTEIPLTERSDEHPDY